MSPIRLTPGTLACLLLSCGGSPSAHRAQLETSNLGEAQHAAPDLVAAALAAAERADDAHRLGDEDAEADFVTRARLLADAARVEQERIEIERERAQLDAQTLRIEREATAQENLARELEAETARAAAARFARSALRSALQLAEEDEARRGRARRVELAEPADLREAARVIAERAQLLAAAATALGEDASGLTAILEESESATEPLAKLEVAQRGLDFARRALGRARRTRSLNSAEIRALREASDEVDITWNQLEVGLATAIDDRNVDRLASIVVMHPHGPVLIQSIAASSTSSARSAARRDAARLRNRLIAEGVPETRIRIEDAPPASPPGAQLVLPAYGGPTPSTNQSERSTNQSEPSTNQSDPSAAGPASATAPEASVAESSDSRSPEAREVR